MSKSPSLRRIQADVRELALDPSDRYHAAPLENDMFEWHFTIRGADGTDFEGGVYHGRILLPAEYPFKPPHIMFLTPSGRFETNTKICLSFSAYHPELWQPAWGIRLILEALISFLPTPADGAIGALDWTPAERRRLARKSVEFCCRKCAGGTANGAGRVVDLLPKPNPDRPPKSSLSSSGSNRFAKEIEMLQKMQIATEGGKKKKKKQHDDQKEETSGNGTTTTDTDDDEDDEHEHSPGGNDESPAHDDDANQDEEEGKQEGTRIDVRKKERKDDDDDDEKEDEEEQRRDPHENTTATTVTNAVSDDRWFDDDESQRKAAQSPSEGAEGTKTSPTASSVRSREVTAAAATTTDAQRLEVPAVVEEEEEEGGDAAVADADAHLDMGWLTDPMLNVCIVLLLVICGLFTKKALDLYNDLMDLTAQAQQSQHQAYHQTAMTA